jgi:uncharacterized repeat protein (TIGR01451 family)
LTFTITNPAANTVPLTGVAFTDPLPPGLSVTNGTMSECGGTLIISGGNTIALSGASIAVDSQCQFAVTVTAVTGGAYDNVTGNVTSANGGTGNFATATMSAPVSLGGSIGLKSGPQNARVWPMVIGNNGPGTATDIEITSVVLTQTRGSACTPVVTTPMPDVVGNIAERETATVNVVINFTGCASNTVFTTTVGLEANGGVTVTSFSKLNQLQ